MLFRIQKIFAVFAALVLVGISGLYIYLSTLEGKRAEPLKVFAQQIEKPLFFAHRGGADEAPENTLPAFEKAAQSGVDVLELDIHGTSDGELVVHHDSSLERTTDGNGLIAETSLADIKQLDAGYDFKRDGRFPFRGQGIEVPTLREVFVRFPDKLINIEVKSSDTASVSTLCSLISEFKRNDSVIVASVGSPFLTKFRSDCEGVATSASFGETLWFLLLYKVGLSENFDAEMQALQVPENMFWTNIISKDFITAAKERNLKIHIWTANKKTDIKRLVDAGVDGIMTDRPSLIREAALD